MAKKNTVTDLKKMLEEAEVRADLSEARARSAEAVLRLKQARLLNDMVTAENVLDML